MMKCHPGFHGATASARRRIFATRYCAIVLRERASRLFTQYQVQWSAQAIPHPARARALLAILTAFLWGETIMASAKKKILIPGTISPAAIELLKKRDDVDAVVYDVTISTAQFHSLLKDAQGVALSMTPFGEAELK